MKQIENDIQLQEIHKNGQGFVFNDFSGKRVLHKASCGWVIRCNTKVPKIFFEDKNEAIKWLQANRGMNWKSCDTCGTDSHSASIHSPKIKSEEKAVPFVEANVEDILVRYLQKSSYSVHRQVTCHNGIVDVVAENSNSHWIIEVKGEDKGGFGTAQMNFQMGVGQIVSRMTEQGIFYALAIPMTDKFKRILRNYKGSIGFKLLGLWFFVIHRDGRVDKLDASAMFDYIGAW